MPPSISDVAAIVIVAIWAAWSFLAAYTGDYEGLQLVTPIMVILAGALFVIRRNGN